MSFRLPEHELQHVNLDCGHWPLVYANKRPEHDQLKNPARSHACFVADREAWTSTGQKLIRNSTQKKNKGVTSNTGNLFPHTFFSYARALISPAACQTSRPNLSEHFSIQPMARCTVGSKRSKQFHILHIIAIVIDKTRTYPGGSY